MKKSAVANVGAEEAAEVTRTILNRDTARAEVDAMFGGDSKKMRLDAGKHLKELFVQAIGAEYGTTPSLEMPKTASVDAFFEQVTAPTEAQRRYPELMKVAKATTLKTPAAVLSQPLGATPVKSGLSGGSA